MKICWKNLENLTFSKNGTFRKRSDVYIEKESCKNCNESYLTIKSIQGNFCSQSCANSKEHNPNFGKVTTDITKRKMSISKSGKKNHFFGKKHTEKTKTKTIRN